MVRHPRDLQHIPYTEDPSRIVGVDRADVATLNARIADLEAALVKTEAQLSNVSARLRKISDECADASFAAYKIRDV